MAQYSVFIWSIAATTTALQTWPVESPIDQLVLRSDCAVDSAVGSLCWSLDQETKGLEYVHKRAPDVP